MCREKVHLLQKKVGLQVSVLLIMLQKYIDLGRTVCRNQCSEEVNKIQRSFFRSQLDNFPNSLHMFQKKSTVSKHQQHLVEKIAIPGTFFRKSSSSVST